MPRQKDNRHNIVNPGEAGPRPGLSVLVREGFVVGHYDLYRVPAWVSVRWTREDHDRLQVGSHPRPFAPDEELPRYARAGTNYDFASSAMERGHMARHEDNEAWGEDNSARGCLGTGPSARVVAQQRYDAYGQVLSADHMVSHPFLSVGHKGLFYDRLDRGVSDTGARGTVVPPSSTTAETPRLVPFARGVYHVRNRAVIAGGGSPTSIGQPSYVQQGSLWSLSQTGLSSGAAVPGRFMQADPNATGMVIMASLAYHGRELSPEVDQFDIDRRFADGANLYQYLGSNAWNRSDSLGLFGLIPQVISTGFDAYMNAEGTLEDARQGILTFGGLYSLMQAYRTNQLLDAMWASDWSASDDFLGIVQTDSELPSIGGVHPLDLAIAGVRRGTSRGRNLFQEAIAKARKSRLQRGVSGLPNVQGVEQAIDSLKKGPKGGGRANTTVLTYSEAVRTLRGAFDGIQERPARSTYKKGEFGWEHHSEPDRSIDGKDPKVTGETAHLKYVDYRAGKNNSGGRRGHVYYLTYDGP